MIAAIRLAPILSDFDQDLDRTEHLLQLVGAFRDFAASRVPDEVSDRRVVWAEAQSLSALSPKVRTDLPIISGSLLLYICGRFENFVRELVVAIADDLSSKASVYGDLPEKLRAQMFDQALSVASSPRRYGFSRSDGEQIVIQLAGNLTHQSGSIEIRSDLLAITESNMNSRTLADVFKRVDLEDIWRELGKQAPLKSHLGVGDDSQCRSTATSRLDGIMKDRNGLAHPTAGTIFPATDKVKEDCSYFRVLGKVLVDVLQVPH
ncbi:HEPN domain-containing protein [Nocardia sp. NPDC003999]